MAANMGSKQRPARPLADSPACGSAEAGSSFTRAAGGVPGWLAGQLSCHS